VLLRLPFFPTVPPRAAEQGRPQAGDGGSPSLPSPRLLPVPLLLGRADARGGTTEQSRAGARSGMTACATASPASARGRVPSFGPSPRGPPQARARPLPMAAARTLWRSSSAPCVGGLEDGQQRMRLGGGPWPSNLARLAADAVQRWAESMSASLPCRSASHRGEGGAGRRARLCRSRRRPLPRLRRPPRWCRGAALFPSHVRICGLRWRSRSGSSAEQRKHGVSAEQRKPWSAPAHLPPLRRGSCRRLEGGSELL
jgi:hypothetical protein